VDSSGSGKGSLASSCEHGSGTLGSMEGEEFLDQLSDYQLFRKVCVLGSYHTWL